MLASGEGARYTMRDSPGARLSAVVTAPLGFLGVATAETSLMEHPFIGACYACRALWVGRPAQRSESRVGAGTPKTTVRGSAPLQPLALGDKELERKSNDLQSSL